MEAGDIVFLDNGSPVKRAGDMIDLTKIAARAAAATKGPWFFSGYSDVHSAETLKAYHDVEATLRDATDAEWDAATFPETRVASVPVIAGDTATPQGAADADFIAHARTDVETLLAEVTTLRGVLAQIAALPRYDVSATSCECCGTTYSRDVYADGEHIDAAALRALLAEVGNG